ncbi:ribosome recycling factor domain-containing protein [Cokeromyces recurvatus]|uniref:ribosome recycling factor domain-containing protein n=1 Tax=Cokeromyces recurvatus TaxID=90255 RepID=UPI00221FA51A|nr:ribosome recycling factor domain-containing protein [Cokeromyces recurvatus]KAI7904345.1 ribosome recycling factor domain-containing protein [Cokeromyces recurvatus]
MSLRLLRSVAMLQGVLKPAAVIAPRMTPAKAVWQRPVLTTAARFYAKNNKKKHQFVESQTKKEQSQVLQFDEENFQARFDQSINQLKEHLANIRIGRATPSLLDNVRVRIENSHYPIKDLAQITVRDPQTLIVTVHDGEYISAVDKSIREAGLNLNPILDNKIIKVPIPKATKETRDKLAKLVSSTGEQTKHKIRSIRQDGMKQLKHDMRHTSADDIKKLDKLVQNTTDKYNKMVEELLKTKIKEIQS